MREAAFVKQNKEKWIAFEKAITLKSQLNPDTLADHYIHLTNDLAFAQSYYPDSKTLLYLNSLTTQAHQQIYKNKKEQKNRIVSFWKTEFPLFFAAYQKELFYALIFFCVAIAIGVLSMLFDDTFARAILGDSYVNQTMDNIDSGNPTAIYSSGGEFGTFIAITVNNIRVAIMAFAFGVIAGIGTVYILFLNGVMVGAFFTMFYNSGVFWEASKNIMLHGTIELSVIVVAGCAGLVMGKGILFPKTFSRRVSFMKAAKDGLKIVVSTIPFFIIAGFIEGFITRYNTMPIWLALTIIMGSFGLIIYYYFWYPIQLKKQYGARES